MGDLRLEHFETIEEYNESLDCPACRSLCINPVSEICGHSVCRSCHGRILTDAMQKTCPVCRTPVTIDPPINFLAQEIVGSILARCNSCRMESSVHAILQHVQTCQDMIIGCCNEGCNVPVKRKERVEHSTVCPRETIHCSICHRVMERGQLEWHGENECIGRQVGCSLKCNESNISRIMLLLHPLQCEQVLRKCEVSGCQFWGDTNEMRVHSAQSRERHLYLAQRENSTTMAAVINRAPIQHREIVNGIFTANWMIAATTLMNREGDFNLRSPIFTLAEMSWSICLSRRGEKHLASILFLEGDEIFVKYRLTILKRNEQHIINVGPSTFVHKKNESVVALLGNTLKDISRESSEVTIRFWVIKLRLERVL